jgi:type VI secretion system secreted protein VgrG
VVAAGFMQQRHEECTNLNDKVQAAKDAVGDFHPARCKAGMSLWQLLQRKNAWLEEASARAKRDQKCWNGGDDDHQRAQAAAWNNAQNCGLMANPGTLP